MKVHTIVCLCIAIVAIAVVANTRCVQSTSIPPLGFVILRHVSSYKTDQYWKRCYESIRAIYAHEPILIIDDSVDRSRISKYETHNTTVVDSEYTGRGELLPYIYYFRYKISERAIFLHDSVFLTRRVPFRSSEAYQHLWNFETESSPCNPDSEAAMLASCSTHLLPLYREKGRWKGVSGPWSSSRTPHWSPCTKSATLCPLYGTSGAGQTGWRSSGSLRAFCGRSSLYHPRPSTEISTLTAPGELRLMKRLLTRIYPQSKSGHRDRPSGTSCPFSFFMWSS